MKKKLIHLMLVMFLGLAGTALAPAYVYAEEETWVDEDWAEDDYGYYDEDFYWETDDEDWDTWYGEDDEDWDYYYEDNTWENEDEWWDWW